MHENAHGFTQTDDNAFFFSYRNENKSTSMHTRSLHPAVSEFRTSGIMPPTKAISGRYLVVRAIESWEQRGRKDWQFRDWHIRDWHIDPGERTRTETSGFSTVAKSHESRSHRRIELIIGPKKRRTRNVKWTLIRNTTI